jgi:hypothetical protein
MPPSSFNSKTFATTNVDGEMPLRERADGYEPSLLPATSAEPAAVGLLSRRPVATFLLLLSGEPGVHNLDEHRVAGGLRFMSAEHGAK